MVQVLFFGSLVLKDCGFSIGKLEPCAVLSFALRISRKTGSIACLIPLLSQLPFEYACLTLHGFRKYSVFLFLHFSKQNVRFLQFYLFLLLIYSDFSTYMDTLGFRWLPLPQAPGMPPTTVFPPISTRLQPNISVCLLLGYQNHADIMYHLYRINNQKLSWFLW